MIVNTSSEFRAALENANVGDVIKLAQHHFIGPFFVKKAGILICSADANNPATIKDTRAQPSNGSENFTLTIKAAAVTLRNIHFKSPHSISVRINESSCTLEDLHFQHVKIAFICSAADLTFKNIKIQHFTEDGIRLSSDNFKGENILIENLHASRAKAHHDGIQLYAGKPHTPLRHAGRYEGKYALNKGSLKNVVIRSTTDNNRPDVGALQGIFSSDGFMDGIQLDNIQVITHNCIHGVSLRGIRTAKDGTPSLFKNVTIN